MGHFLFAMKPIMSCIVTPAETLRHGKTEPPPHLGVPDGGVFVLPELEREPFHPRDGFAVGLLALNAPVKQLFGVGQEGKNTKIERNKQVCLKQRHGRLSHVEVLSESHVGAAVAAAAVEDIVAPPASAHTMATP